MLVHRDSYERETVLNYKTLKLYTMIIDPSNKSVKHMRSAFRVTTLHLKRLGGNFLQRPKLSYSKPPSFKG